MGKYRFERSNAGVIPDFVAGDRNRPQPPAFVKMNRQFEDMARKAKSTGGAAETGGSAGTRRSKRQTLGVDSDAGASVKRRTLLGK